VKGNRGFVQLLVALWLAATASVGSGQVQPAVAQTTPLPGVEAELIAEGLTAPLFLAEPPDGSGRLFIVDQTGLIQIVDTDGEVLADPFLDLQDQMTRLLEAFDERGLLGFAFHPDYAENGLFYVSYSAPLRPDAPAGWNYTRHTSEFRVSDEDPNRSDASSERVLLAIDWPSRKHNGGALAFGPDGYLYIGLGDAGGAHGVGEEVLYSAFEVPARQQFWDRFAQDTSSLYGSILRIDVDGGYPGYAIPPTNPFVNNPAGRDEIYAWGFRNPYRLSFDRKGTHDMFVTAVAETLWEAIYLVNQPGNYGWAIKEATHCFDRQRPNNPPATCPSTGALGYPLIDPIIEYPNMSIEGEDVQVEGEGMGTAVTGGYLYRGSAMPELVGKFIFADWSRDPATPSGQIFVATPPQVWGDLWSLQQLLELETRVLSLGEDAAGELYVLTSEEFGPFGDTGKVFKLVPEPAATAPSDSAPLVSGVEEAYPNTQLPVEPSWLAERLDDPAVRIIDMRAPDAYASGHIPGAINLPVSELVSTVDSIPFSFNQDRVQQALNRAGLTPNMTAVVYDNLGMMDASRLFWTLEYVGHEDVRILHGGWNAWNGEDRPTTTEASAVEPTTYPITLDASKLATAEDILSRLDDPEVVFVDARSPQEYSGEVALAARSGHIPGAVNLVWLDTLTGGDAVYTVEPDWRAQLQDEDVERFKQAADIQMMLDDLGITADKEVITYCQTLWRGAHVYFLLRLMGFDQVRDYDGSWVEWSNQRDLPVVTGSEPGSVATVGNGSQ
jgi:3-mercaptopyruvate sulfurtransferase SseA/glucose/arabinose dehydrogenase